MVERYVVPERDVLKAHPELSARKMLGQSIEVLKNLKRITHPDYIDMYEGIKTRSKYASLMASRLEGFTPDYDGLKAVHKHIFEDVYEWAGKSRAERVTIEGETFTPEPHTWSGKGGVDFAPNVHLETQTPRLMKTHMDAIDLSVSEGRFNPALFSEHAAKVVGDMNFAHPFREGNGRAMRGFLHQFGRHYGIEINLAGFEDRWIESSAKAMNGDYALMSKVIFDNSRTMTDLERAEWNRGDTARQIAPVQISLDEGIKILRRDMGAANRDLLNDESRVLGDKILAGVGEGELKIVRDER